MSTRLSVPARTLAAALFLAVGTLPALAQGPGRQDDAFGAFRWQFQEQHRIRTGAPSEVPGMLRMTERNSLRGVGSVPRFGAGAGRSH
jgi:hypothetical protein